MNNEQNINDILKLLKSSYDKTSGDDDGADSESAGHEELTNDELKARLIEQFATGGANDEKIDAGEPEYKLDEEFFAPEAEIFEDDTEDDSEERAFEAEEVLDEQDNISEEMPLVEELCDDEEEDDGIPPFDLEEQTLADVSTKTEDISDESLDIDEVDLAELLRPSRSEPEYEEQEAVEELAQDAEEPDVEQEQPCEFYSGESGQLALFENSEASEEEAFQSEEDTLEERADEAQIVLDFGDSDEGIESSYNDAEVSNIDTSFLGLMLEIGDGVPIGKNPSTERVDIYDLDKDKNSVSDIEPHEAFGFCGEEYTNSEQADEILYSYAKDKKYTLLRLIGSGVFAFFLAVLELLPKLNVKLFGVLNYEKYPTVYLLFAIQLLVLTGVFAWRELWRGLKRAFCFKADIWSFSAIVTAAVIVYEAGLAVLLPLSLPKTYGTYAALYILLGLVCEYLSVKRELKSFEVYSSDSVKYTLRTEPLANSAAEKMYRGGISSKVNIFEPSLTSFPNGYFSEVNRKKESDTIINGFITPMILAGAVFWVISMILGVSLVDSLEMFMLSLASLCPAAIFISRVLPMYVASSRLYDRGSAIASETSAKKYASCDMLVFRDSHLFKSSKAENNGIVIYDKKNTRKIVQYLNSLYVAIGGPMKTLFADASEESFEPYLKRIARNGVEAVINGQCVILGDAEFQRRYGISFPEGELVQTGEGILCMSVDGVPSAKLCLRYATEPVFEMIVSKMEADGISCAIETYDPIIDSAFVAASRSEDKAPINVVHKNANDYYSEMPENVDGKVGIVACSSRLKLVECVVWCKRIFVAKKACFKVHVIMAVITLLILGGLLLTGYSDIADQYAVLLLQVVGVIPTLAVIFKKLPRKDHFSVEDEEQGNRE